MKSVAPEREPQMKSERQTNAADEILLSRALAWSPLIFICHVVEEAPGFVAWFNAHVTRAITSETFWGVNLSGLIITVALVGFDWLARSSFSLVIVVAWLSFIMPANALLHIVASVSDESYVPGLLTAIVLYLPCYCWLLIKIKKSGRLNVGHLVGAAILGSIPMLIHGYRIVFLGSRLF